MSFRARILDEILRTLKEDVTFEPAEGDDVPAISQEAIVWRRLPAPGADGVQEFVLEDLPGIIVSTPRITIPPNEGENDRDVWHYQWLIQICSRELPSDGANQKTYWNWQEQIADQFLWDNLDDKINDEIGVVYVTYTTLVDDVDLKTWVKAQNFVAGVIVTTDLQRRRRVGQTII